MKIERGYAQHVGSRNEQQDAGLVLTDDGRAEQLVVVADGMGGHAGGSIASAQVAETARHVWAEHRKSPLEPKRLLERIIREGHEAINKAGAEKGLTPRSTCALLFLRDGGREGTAHWAHVGDSRIYRLREGQVARLTRDHSVVQMLVDLGKVSEDEMGTHPDQNRLTQSLGGEAQPMPDFGSDSIKPHDAFMVCSDGLWEMIPQREMAAALAAKKLGDDGAKHLAERAFDRAKPKSDNITVALLRIGGPPPGGIGADAEESRTTRMPGRIQRPAARGPRWGFAAATVVALGAAAALVYKPWDRQGLDSGTSPAVGPKEKPVEPATPPQQEKRGDSPKQETPPDPAPKPAEKREGPPTPPPQQPQVVPPNKDPAVPAPDQPKPPGEQGKPSTDPPRGGPPPEKRQAQPPKPQQQPPRQPAPTPPRQSSVGPDEKKKPDPADNTEKPAATPPQGPGQDTQPKPQSQ